MKNLKKLFIALIFTSGVAHAEGSFELEEMHESAKVGISWYLQQASKNASDVTGYAIGKRDEGALLRIFFADRSQARLFCHFHDDHDDDHDHDHDHDPSLEDIDCHVL